MTEGYQPPPAPPGPPPAPPTPAAPARASRTPAVVASIVFVVTLVLCLGGAATSFLVLQRLEPRGSAAPETALEGFLRAVFIQQDAGRAADFVCAESGDDRELARLVFEVRAFTSRYASASTRWTYPEVRRTGRRDASADVTLTLTTTDRQVSEKQVRLLMVDDNGWWVCEVEAIE